MRRIVLVFAVLSFFFACADSENPSAGTPPATDSGAKADAKKDTGTTATGDSGEGEEDSGTKPKDSGSDTDTEDDSSTPDDASTPDTSTPDTSTPDTSTPDTSTPETSTDAGDCNDLVFDNPQLSLVAAAGAKPARTGGTPADGTYDLTGYRIYGSAAPTYTLRSIVRLTGNKIEALKTLNGSTERTTGTFVITGSSIAIAWTCSQPAGITTESGTFTYTAGTGKFSYYQSDLSVEAEHTKK